MFSSWKHSEKIYQIIENIVKHGNIFREYVFAFSPKNMFLVIFEKEKKIKFIGLI